MHVAAIQYDIAWEDKAANHATLERMIEDAALAPGTLILLPELGDTGFSFDLDAIVDDRTVAWAAGVARRRGCVLQAGYAERGADHKGRNCSAILSSRGETLGVYRKVHPFSYGRESEHYSGGDRLLIVPVEGAAVCPMICYDLRFPELWRLAAAAGAEVFTIGASWPAARQAHWRSLLVARAIENQAFVVAANRTGRDPHLSYEGGSLIVSPTGEILAEAGDAPAVLSADLDLAQLRRWREAFPALRDMRKDLLGAIPVDRPAPAERSAPPAPPAQSARPRRGS